MFAVKVYAENGKRIANRTFRTMDEALEFKAARIAEMPSQLVLYYELEEAA